jgi:hypothetical protein
MITAAEYAKKQEELKNINFVEREIIPASEPVFNVFLNTRKIEVPSHFREIAKKGDHNAETVWFALDRYFDGEDLYNSLNNKNKVWAVQCINALGEEYLFPISNIYLGNGNSDSTTFTIGWTITYDVTKAAGRIQFSLRCYEIEDNKLSYNLGTEVVTVTVGESLYLQDTNESINPPKDVLTTLVAKIEDLYMNNASKAYRYDELTEESLPLIDGTMLIGDVSSDVFTNIDYTKIKNAPTYIINGNVLKDNENLELLAEADATLNANSTNPIQNKAVAAAIAAIREELDELTYVPLSIVSFDNNLKLYEKNSTYKGAITFSWEIGGNAKTLDIYKGSKKVNTSSLPINTTTGTQEISNQELTDTTEYKLVATDPKGNTIEKTTSVVFTYKVFYGTAAADPDTFTTAFLTNLTGTLQETPQTTFTVDCGKEGQYIYFAAPSGYGVNKDSFWSGGFQGGFTQEKVGSINYNKTTYDIWRTVNKLKSNVEITIK